MDARKRLKKIETMLPPAIKLTLEHKLEIMERVIRIFEEEERYGPLSEKDKATLVLWKAEYKRLTRTPGVYK